MAGSGVLIYNLHEVFMAAKEMIVPSYVYTPIHLLQFRESPESYQALLGAIRHVLEKRETPMPFIPEDVFGRHEFLGGELYLLPVVQNMTVVKRRSKSAMFQESSDISQREFWQIFFDEDEKVDLKELAILKRIRDFCRYAYKQGDMIMMSPEHSSDDTERFQLKVGGRTISSPPPLGESVFFHTGPKHFRLSKEEKAQKTIDRRLAAERKILRDQKRFQEMKTRQRIRIRKRMLENEETPH